MYTVNIPRQPESAREQHMKVICNELIIPDNNNKNNNNKNNKNNDMQINQIRQTIN